MARLWSEGNTRLSFPPKERDLYIRHGVQQVYTELTTESFDADKHSAYGSIEIEVVLRPGVKIKGDPRAFPPTVDRAVEPVGEDDTINPFHPRYVKRSH